VPEIVQSRHFGQSLVDETKAHECALLIVGLPYQSGLGGHFDLGETAEYALKNANCRVWLVRGQRPEGPVPAPKAERPDVVGAAR
jgi:nucleotide-binding universal stress UspA family protein